MQARNRRISHVFTSRHHLQMLQAMPAEQEGRTPNFLS
jgi:hypothetical protein